MAEIIKREGTEVEFKVTVAAQNVVSAYQRVYAALARQVKVPGFRPGKAPLSVLIKRAGQDAVDGDVRQALLDDSFKQAIDELKLSLIDIEVLPEALADGQDFVYTVKAHVYPEVNLPDWQAISLEAPKAEVTEEQIAQTLQDLRERNATFESVERAAEGSDQLTIEEQGEEGGTYPVYLDSAPDNLKDALLGKSTGEEVSIDVPGSEGEQITVKIIDIKQKQLPELDDELAVSLGLESLEKLQELVGLELNKRAEQEGLTARREEFVSKLIEGLEADIPASMIERRRDGMFEEIKSDLSRQGIPFETYEEFMKQEGKYEEFLADLEKNALVRVKRELALEKLAEVMGVGLTEQEWEAQLANFARANKTTVSDVKNQLGMNGLNNYYAQLIRDKAWAIAVSQLDSKAVAPLAEAVSAE